MARILVIDDEDMVRTTVRLILEKNGHQVIEAKNGNDGLRVAGGAKPDLVITDIIMPQKEGLETIMELKTLAPGTRIVAMSGGGRTRNLDFLTVAKKLGADHALRKPFTSAQLLEAVRTVLKS